MLWRQDGLLLLFSSSSSLMLYWVLKSINIFFPTGKDGFSPLYKGQKWGSGLASVFPEHLSHSPGRGVSLLSPSDNRPYVYWQRLPFPTPTLPTTAITRSTTPRASVKLKKLEVAQFMFEWGKNYKRYQELGFGLFWSWRPITYVHQGNT